MSRRPVVLPEAETEIQEAMRWYEHRRPGLGEEFFGTVERAMQRAAEAPLRWRTWPDETRFRRVVAGRFPYLLFYGVRGDTIEVVAIAHAKREPGYWRERVRGR